MAKQVQNHQHMYRKEFTAKLAARMGVGQEEADEITTAFLGVLKETWEQKRSICFFDFGVFELRPVHERMGRNPKTMEDHLIPAGYKPVFRPTRSLRDAVNRAIRSGSGPQAPD